MWWERRFQWEAPAPGAAEEVTPMGRNEDWRAVWREEYWKLGTSVAEEDVEMEMGLERLNLGGRRVDEELAC